MPNTQSVYVDACVFLDYVNGEGEIETIRAVLEDAKQGELELHTSLLTMAEVAFGWQEQKACALDDATAAKIEALWHQPKVIRLIDPTRLVMDKAKSILRDLVARGKGAGIGGADAVHLASAARRGVGEFFTTDEKLLTQVGSVVPFKIIRPWSGTLKMGGALEQTK